MFTTTPIKDKGHPWCQAINIYNNMLITFQITFCFQGYLNSWIDGFRLKGGGEGREKTVFGQKEKETKSKGKKLQFIWEKITSKLFKEKRLCSNTSMILRGSVIRNSPLPMRCVLKLDCNHPIVDSKKSDKPLFFVYMMIFIHSSPSRGFSLKPRQTVEAQP